MTSVGGRVGLMNRSEFITLAGQVVNGILSSDNSVLSKLIDRAVHHQVADSAFNITRDILVKVDEEFGEA